MRPPTRALLTLLILLSGSLASAADARDKRPNILWLVCEDFTATYSGPYGDPLARTPNIDALARRGVTFDHAHASAPVCAPARSSIITGRHAASLGTQNMRSTHPLPPGVRFFPEWLRQAGYFCTNNAKTDYNTSAGVDAAWDENGRQAHWRHRKPGQPFFSVFNFEQSHESRLHSRAKLVTDPSKVRVPAYLPDTPEVRADIAQYFDCVSRADAALGRVLEELRADGLDGETLVFCYSDNGGALPRSKRFLYENGTHVALVVYVPPAFASLSPGAPGTHNRELVSFVDLAPTVLSLARVEQAPGFDGRVLFGPDRGEPPGTLVLFRDRMDERYDLARAVTDGRFRYIRNYYPALPWGQHLAYLWQQESTRQWEQLAREGRLNAAQKAFFEPKPAEELFDCANDPDNIRNLAADPAHAATLTRLRSALHAHLLATRDTGLMPEPMMRRLSGGRSPTLVAHDEAQYPLLRLLDLIDALQLPNSFNRAACVAGLADRNPAVRYWAAVGAWGAAEPALLLPLLSDGEPLVRLAAAEGLLRNRDSASAWKVIEAAMESDSGELRLYALNVISRVPRPCPSGYIPRFRQMAASPAKGMDTYVARAAEALLTRTAPARQVP